MSEDGEKSEGPRDESGILRWLNRASVPLSYSIYLVVVIALGFLFLSGPDGEDLMDQLSQATGSLAYLVLFSAFAGLAGMATVQFWKVAFLPRRSFHESELQSHFGEAGWKKLRQVTNAGGGSTPSPPDTRRHRPMARRRLKDLLNSPTEVLMAQLGAVADHVIEQTSSGPRDESRQLLIALAGDGAREDVDRYLELVEKQPSHGSDSNEDEDHDTLYPVRFAVEQNLDALMISLRERWRWRVQIMAVAASAVISLMGALIADMSVLVEISVVAASAVWGGSFAWFFRDLFALAERRRD